MRRTLVALCWTLAGLVASDRVLSLHDQSARRSSSRLRRLVPPALLQGKAVAALLLEDTARRERVLYARSAGGWRCLSRAGAPADEARLGAFVDRLLEAEGILQREDSGPGERLGLDPPVLLRVSLHGPRVLKERGHDLIAMAEIGAALPGGRGTYARSGLSREVIAVDTDLREDLAWPRAAGLAPLQDPRIVPAAWSGSASVARVEVHPAAGSPFELRRRSRPAKQEELLAGALPWDWLLVAGGREREAPARQANAYVFFLQRATYNLALDPRQAEGLGLAQPRARVILQPAEGRPLEILVGGAAPGGGVGVRNSLTQCTLTVDADVATLLTPREEELRRGAGTSPWEEWLRRERQP